MAVSGFHHQIAQAQQTFCDSSSVANKQRTTARSHDLARIRFYNQPAKLIVERVRLSALHLLRKPCVECATLSVIQVAKETKMLKPNCANAVHRNTERFPERKLADLVWTCSMLTSLTTAQPWASAEIFPWGANSTFSLSFLGF